MLKVIMNKMNGTLDEIITNKAKERIQEELAQRVAEPKKVEKKRTATIPCVGTYQIVSNFTEDTKAYVKQLLEGKKCSELKLIN